MHYAFKLLAASAAASLCLSGNVLAGNNPVDEPWWPSEFGPDGGLYVHPLSLRMTAEHFLVVMTNADARGE